MMKAFVPRLSRVSAARTSLAPSNAFLTRGYAGKKDMSAIPGDQTPQASSNVVAPGSASIEEQNANKSRGLDSESSTDTKGVSDPVSSPSKSGTGQQEEDSSAQGAFKQDPNKSAKEKRQNVEDMGNRPLDAADK